MTLFTDIINEATTEFDSTSEEKIPDDHILNSCFESEDGKSLLFVGIEGGKNLNDYVNVLLTAGVSPNLINEELNILPLHFACKERNAFAMELLLGCGANVNSLQNNGRTALHLCAEAGFKEGINILLKCKDVEIDLPDKKGKQTPLYLAVAKSGSVPIVTALLQHGAKLDRICFKKTIQEHINEKMPGFDPNSVIKTTAPIVRGTSNSMIEQLSDVMDEAALTTDGTKMNDLVANFNSILLQLNAKEAEAFEASGDTLLQKISDFELIEFAKSVLDQKLVDPNHICEGNKMHPILIAAHRGNLELLKLLLEHHADIKNAIKEQTNETILHIILKKDSDDGIQIQKWNDCLSLLIGDSPHENPEVAKRIHDEICQIVNKRDKLSNTSLHYATQKWSSRIVRCLLEHGANIGMKNKWNDVPINSINPDTMEKFLDEHCLTSNYNTKKDGGFIDISNPALQVTFNYSFLAPSNEDLPFDIQQKPSITTGSNLHCNNAVEDEESQQKLAPDCPTNDQTNEVKYVLPETDSLWHMAQSKEHRHLLNHPVITSFLWLKWGRIRRYFNRNLRFYLLFVFVMTWFIFYGLGGIRKANGLSRSNYWPMISQNRSALSPDERQFNEVMYHFYITFVVIMFICIMRDWRSDILDVLKADKLRNTFKWIKPNSMTSGDEGGNDNTCCKDIFRVILSNWMEVLLIAFMISLMIFRENLLWIGMLVLVCILAAREGFQLMVSVRRYILSPENWIEVAMIILVCILLFHPDTEDGIALKRHMAAFAIVLSWTELITLLGKHPKLSR